jgi:hypothetical protein
MVGHGSAEPDSQTRISQTETDVTESRAGSGRSSIRATEERFVTGLDVFIVSFCVAFIAASDRFKALLAGLVRLIR